MLAQGFLRVKSQAKITKCYFLWVDAINKQSLSGHYLMRQQVSMVFSLHLVYLSFLFVLLELWFVYHFPRFLQFFDVGAQS